MKWTTPWTGWVCGILFILASITDYLDGALARKYGAESNLGKLMDPIADKILVLTVLVMLIPKGLHVGPVLVILLVSRDILIGGIRSAAAADKLVISAAAAGKWKTALQMVGIPALLIGDIWVIPFAFLGLCLLWISVILSGISAFQYIVLYFKNRQKRAVD